METLYVLKNSKNRIVGRDAYRTFESAQKSAYDYFSQGHDVFIDKVTVNFAKRSICYLYLYLGFDYGINSMCDVSSVSDLFSCSDEAKKHQWWIDAVKIYEENQKEHYMDRDMICSYDPVLDDRFCFGDVLEDKFRLSIERLKVRR